MLPSPRLNSDKQTNLHVLVETQFVRISIDKETGRVVGVEIRANPRFHPHTSGEPLRMIRARKIVIELSRAYGKPLLLERSVIGDSQVLSRTGIPQVVDLPGIGHGDEDHHMVC